MMERFSIEITKAAYSDAESRLGEFGPHKHWIRDNWHPTQIPEQWDYQKAEVCLIDTRSPSAAR